MIPVPVPTATAATWISDYVTRKALKKGSPVLVLDHHPYEGWLDPPTPNSGQQLRLWNVGGRSAEQVRLNVESFHWSPENIRHAAGVNQPLPIKTAGGLEHPPIDLARSNGRWVALSRVFQDQRGVPELVLMGVGQRGWSADGRLTVGIRVTWEDPADKSTTASHHWTATVDWNGKLLNKGGTIAVAVAES